MYISHLRIRNWKNFKEAETRLGMRVFLIGPNASGKSNFLDIFRFLRDLATPGGGLSKAVNDLRAGVSSVRCLAATRNSDIDVEVALSKEEEEIWRYRLVFNQDQAGKPIIKEEKVSHMKEVVLTRPDDLDEADPDRLTQTALEQIAANKKFRDVYFFFRSVSYQHLLPQVVRDPRGFSPAPVQNDPFGRDFLSRVWQTTSKTRDSRLRKISAALKVAVPQLKDFRIEMDKGGAPHLSGGYEHWRPHAARQDESQFSDGTLRLLGLMWTVFEGEGPLLMEEPELSLHAEIVHRLPELIERIQKERKTRRQIIISTHSRDMLDNLGIGGEEALWLKPTAGGTLICSTEAEDRAQLDAGLTVADVILPKSAPNNINQLTLPFGD